MCFMSFGIIGFIIFLILGLINSYVYAIPQIALIRMLCSFLISFCGLTFILFIFYIVFIGIYTTSTHKCIERNIGKERQSKLSYDYKHFSIQWAVKERIYNINRIKKGQKPIYTQEDIYIWERKGLTVFIIIVLIVLSILRSYFVHWLI